MKNEYNGSDEKVKAMARQTLNRGRVLSDEYFEAPKKQRVICRCGNPVAYPALVRNGSRVCRGCASTIPRNLGGRKFKKTTVH